MPLSFTIIIAVALAIIATIFVIIVTAVLTSNKYSVIKDTNNETILLSDDIIDDVKENFKDSISEYKEEIQLLSPEIIKQKYNLSIDTNQIQEGLNTILKEIETKIDKSIKECISNIKIPEIKPITVQEPEIPEQEVKFTKLSSKTLYDITPDKYIDLLDKEAELIVINNNIMKYIGNINIIINVVSNNSEFWFIEVQKDKNIRYGLSLEQKKRIRNIVNYVNFLKNKPFKGNTEVYKYIKGKINGK